ncbi:MAG: MopE-related protein [Myxococcota bacterium]
MRSFVLSFVFFCLAACTDGGDGTDDPGKDTGEPPEVDLDLDEDGFDAPADCDDGNALVHPGANEHCDGVDQDCDGVVDDAADDATAWYADADEDGFGDPLGSLYACVAPANYVADATDCDDALDTVNPLAVETCNGDDDDCDGVVDPATSAGVGMWYPDADGDGFGRAVAEAVVSCAAPAGYVGEASDCDDADADVFPGAVEACNGVDDDCDAAIDPGTSEGAATWYPDLDADGFGDAAWPALACAAPDAHVADATDCDDAEAAAHPGADEVCDGFDDDCDGVVDPTTSLDAGTWYADVDGDGFGDGYVPVVACDAPAGAVADGSDCDDVLPDVNPGAPEVCDAGDVDEDCDSYADDDDEAASGRVAHYVDDDGDNFGIEGGAATLYCDPPPGWSPTADDCDDTDAVRNPAGWPCTTVLTTADAGLKLSFTEPSAFAGYSLWADDYNLDGEPDYAVGAYYRSGGKGGLYVAFGPESGSMSLTTAADVTFTSTTPTYVGYWTGAAGDLDGDGNDDLAFLATSAGYYAYYTPITTAETLATADVRLTPEAGGSPIVAAGGFDFDGDGRDDVAIGDPNWGGSQGAAYVVSGPLAGSASLSAADLILRGEAAADSAGISIARGGDVDGDGIEDLLVGAHYNDDVGMLAGAAYFVRGGTTGVVSLSDADAIITGTGPYAFVGEAVSGNGDVDGDGYDDMLVGASRNGASYQGAAWLFAGPISGVMTTTAAIADLTGVASYDMNGSTLGELGDLDGDGFGDMVIGALLDATCNSNDRGSVFVYYGPVTGSLACGQADVQLEGTTNNGRFSRGLATPGDLDGDGLGDLLVGAYMESGGSTYFFSGADF